jgi:hypothetical protein
MQRVINLSPGKALCRFCGAYVAMNSLSTHIASAHPRPVQGDMTPTLVKAVPIGRGQRPRSITTRS